MDDDNVSIGSDFSLGSSIDALSKDTDAPDTKRKITKGSKKKPKRAEVLEKEKEINNKYFKWKAGDAKTGESRHLPSHDLHLRRQRLARMYKLKPDLLRQLRNDVKKELLGDSTAISLDYMRRNMAAGMVISYVKRSAAKIKFRTLSQFFQTVYPLSEERENNCKAKSANQETRSEFKGLLH